jgi:hypothetical protein
MLDHDEAFKENLAKLQQFFNSEKREIFETFLNDKNVLMPSNPAEFKSFIYASYLESEFNNF